MALRAHAYTNYFALSRTRKHRRVEWKRQTLVFLRLTTLPKCLIKAKPALGLFKSTKMYAPMSEDSLHVSPEFSAALFTANIAKR